MPVSVHLVVPVHVQGHVLQHKQVRVLVFVQVPAPPLVYLPVQVRGPSYVSMLVPVPVPVPVPIFNCRNSFAFAFLENT